MENNIAINRGIVRAFLLIFVMLFAVPAWAADAAVVDETTVTLDAVAGADYVDDSVFNRVDVTAGTANSMAGAYDVTGQMTVETPTLPETLVLEEVTDESTAA